jgi:hypothetical protein
MTLEIKFNHYFVSKEKAPEYSAKAMELLRSGRGFFSGFQMAELLYRSQVEALSFTEINQMYKHIPFQTIKSILSGKFSPETSAIFAEMLQDEKEMLTELFTVTTTNNKGEVKND